MRSEGLDGLERSLLSSRNVRRVLTLLVAGAFLFSLGHWLFVVNWPTSPTLVRFHVDLDREGNLATWFNAFILLLAAAAAALMAWMAGQRYNGWSTNRTDTWGWLFVTGVFFYLHVDDAAQLHDVFAWALQGRILDTIPLPVPNAMRWYAWIPVFMVLGVIAISIMFVFFRRNIWLVPMSSVLVLIGLILFLVNPVVEVAENRRIDLLPDAVVRTSEVLFEHNRAAWVELQQLIIIEETSEMLGSICFLAAFLVFGMTVQQPASETVQSRLPRLSIMSTDGIVPDRILGPES